jgi:nucleoside-diphosphate-sugar epimerase
VTRLLVTGASGFIGQEVLRLTCEDQLAGFEVHAICRTPPSGPFPRITWHAGDVLSMDHNRFLRGIGPTHLLHLAWATERKSYWTTERNLGWLEAGVKLLVAFRDAGGRRFVGVGTCSEYAPSALPCSELSTPLAPWSLYGASKAAMSLVTSALARDQLATAWARLFFLYGPAEPNDRLVPRLLSAATTGAVLSVQKEHVRDYLHVTDVARGLLSLVRSDITGPVNIGSGIGITVSELAQTAARAANGLIRLSTPDAVSVTSPSTRFSDAPAYVVSNNDRLRSTGWKPTVDLEEGLRAMASGLSLRG